MIESIASGRISSWPASRRSAEGPARRPPGPSSAPRPWSARRAAAELEQRVMLADLFADQLPAAM
ncbi:MAG TPA: hypothetical protein VIH37_04945 [Candidatus Limnocylindrales bacterium]